LDTSLTKFLRNAGWNIIGQTAPLLVAVVVLPRLIGLMGIDRYGFLTLVWVLVGYAGLFDFGLGRAITRTVANRLAAGDDLGARRAAIVGMTYLLVFGLCVGLVFAALSPWLSRTAFKIPESMHREAMLSLLLLSISIPLTMLSAGYASILTAHQRFGAMNIVRAVLGVATYLGPLLVVLYANRLELVVGFVAVMRFLTNRVYAHVCKTQCGVDFRPIVPDRETSKELFSLGGWITVSNVVSPFLTYLDRLILGALVAMQAVAYYATPYDMVLKSLIIPYALVGAIFPVAAGLSNNSLAAKVLFFQSVRTTFLIMMPMELAIFVLGPPVLEVWLGREFSLNGGPVVQCLAVGLLLNSLAQIPAMMIQAAGRPKWMAVLHLIELPVFLLLLWYLTSRLGITGTAIASVVRFSIDAIMLYFLALRGIMNASVNWRPVLEHSAMTIMLFSGILILPAGKWFAFAYLPVAVTIFAFYAWVRIIQPAEKMQLVQKLRSAVEVGS